MTGIETVTGLLATIRQTGPLVFLAVALASGIIIFAPIDFATTLGLIEFRNEYRSVLGATFLLSSALVVVNALYKIGMWVGKRARWHRNAKALNKHLEDLTAEERGYLVPYVLGDVTTQHFLIEDGIAGGLVAKNIIYRSSNVFGILQGPAYNMQPWAKARLRDHPELLEGAIVPERYRQLLNRY